MSLSSSAPIRLRFGAFELDIAAGQLRKNGTLIKLQPQPFCVLQLLAERSGTVVTREEIQNCLWSDSTFVDFEHGINFAINQIRAALADNVEKPRYIETLPRRGYRFLATVEQTNGVPPASKLADPVGSVPEFDTATFDFPSVAASRSQPDTPSAFEPRPKAKWNWRPLAVVIAFCSIAGFFIRRVVFPPPPRLLSIDQLTQSGRADPWGRITTDGSRLFYLERVGDHWNSMETGTSGGESQPFHVPFPNTRILAISPDNSQLLLAPFTTRSGNLPLWIMPLVGGAPRRLGDLVANDATFSPDGKQIALAETDGIFLTDLDGSGFHKIANVPGENWCIAWSPNGKVLRFTHAGRSVSSSLLFEVTTEGQNLHEFLPRFTDKASPGCGRWTSDGSYYLFANAENGRGDLWAVREPLFGVSWLRPKPVRLTSGPVSYSEPLPTDHGQLLYAHAGRELIDVISVDPRTSQAKQLLPGIHAWDAVFSPDGQWLSYVTLDGLWRSHPDGSERMQLATNSPDRFTFYSRWRPDSRFILYFEQGQNGKDQIYIVPTDGGPRRAILGADHALNRPDWSPDGKTVVFSIADEPRPGRVSENGIYFFNLETGGATKVPASEGFFETRWSPDGRYLAVNSTDSTVLTLYDVWEKRWTEIARGKLISVPVWSRDAKYLYFQDILGPGEALSRFYLKDSSIEAVFSFEGILNSSATRCGFIDFAPDGSLLVRTSGNGSDLYRLKLDLP